MAGRVEYVPQTILTFDIESYGAAFRTDPDRVAMREAARRLVSKTLLRLLGDPHRYLFLDTGDGGILLIDPLQPKADIPGVVAPQLLRGLRKYNAAAADSRQMRWRIALHFGEVALENDATGLGKRASGEAINFSCRLQDSAVTREALKSSGADAVVVISDEYYRAVVKHNHASSELVRDDFEAAKVENKETSTTAWLLKDSVAYRVSTKPTANRSSINRRKGEISRIELNQLGPGAIYLAISDIHNHELYRREQDPPPLAQQLDTALLLADRVVMHCADPLRSEIVANLLEEYRDFVATGRIIFLLGENAVDPAGDFRAYIKLKLEQYRRESPEGRDVVSLEQPNAAAWERATRILGATPVALTRGYSGTDRFVTLVDRDLRHTESLTTREPISASAIRELPLSLRQILTWQRVSDSGELQAAVCTMDELARLQDGIANAAQKRSFSRNILLDLITKHLLSIGEHPYMFTRLVERISILHLRATIGNLPFMEVTRARDARSPFFHLDLLQHIALIANRNPPARVGAAAVTSLVDSKEWANFRTAHLATFGRARALESGLAESRNHEIWRDGVHRDTAQLIERVAKSAWKI